MTTSDSTADHVGRGDSRLRRVLKRLAPSQQDLEDRELQDEVKTVGCTPIAEAVDRQKVVVAGALKHVTLRPRSGTPALEAELYDGSSSVIVVWLGRRRIAGIEPGVSLTVQGRISTQNGVRVIYNPRYQLRSTHDRHA